MSRIWEVEAYNTICALAKAAAVVRRRAVSCILLVLMRFVR